MISKPTRSVYRWWGYLSIWNLIDYPSCIMPVSQVEQGDLKDESYVPINDDDRENYDLYDPKVFKGAPVALQLVGQTFQEEKLLAIAAAVDQVIGLGKV
jgi:amidase